MYVWMLPNTCILLDSNEQWSNTCNMKNIKNNSHVYNITCTCTLHTCLQICLITFLINDTCLKRNPGTRTTQHLPVVLHFRINWTDQACKSSLQSGFKAPYCWPILFLKDWDMWWQEILEVSIWADKQWLLRN